MIVVGVCKKNHEIRGENVYEIQTKHNGPRRICKRCHIERQRAYDQRRREQRIAERAVTA